MADDADLAEAWEQVHDNTPEGWFVGRPGWEDRYTSSGRCTPSTPRRRPWSASGHGSGLTVGQSELDCVQDMARCLGELKAGRWPK